MQTQALLQRAVRRAPAPLAALTLFGLPTLANSTPYDGTGVIVQGASCLASVDDNTGQLRRNVFDRAVP